MRKEHTNWIFVLMIAGSFAFVSACHHRVASTAPATNTPQPATTAAPTVTLQASPSTITNGEHATLTWSSQNATQLTLSPSVGGVSAQGSTDVNPSQSTTYTITATGPGGTTEASASVTLSAASQPAASESLDQLFQEDVKDAFFDYNKWDIRSDSRQALLNDAEFLRSHPEVKFVIAGHCDERGSEEYNLGLGDRRATAAKDYLVNLGISSDRIQTTSYGKEKPFCTQEKESCWQQNRRDHLLMAQ
jgi:peptidoglycan-associated lipoprotein